MKEYLSKIIILYVSTVFIISDIYVAQPILPTIVHEFNVTPEKASLAVSLTILFLSLTLLFYGPISDYYGRKKIMVLTGLLLFIPSFLIAFSKDYTFFLIMRSLQGCFVSGIAAIAMAYISEEFPWTLLGRVMGIYIMAMITAGLTGRILGGIITGLFNWRIMFVFFAFLNIIGSFLMLVFLPKSKNFKQSLSLLSSFRGMFLHLKNRFLVGAFLIGFCLFFTFTCIFTYVSFYLTSTPFNLSTIQLSLIYFVYIAGIISPFSGAISNRIGRQPVILAGLFTVISGIVLTSFKNLTLVIAGLFLLCTGLFISQPATSALVSEKAKNAKGSATSLYLFSYYIGGSFGAYFPGYFYNMFGWTGIMFITIFVASIAICSLLILCRD